MPEADESSSFLLLPRDAAHDVVVLPSLPRVEQWEPPASLGAQRQPLPATTEAFRGRNVESYRVVSAILDRRLVTISGEPVKPNPNPNPNPNPYPRPNPQFNPSQVRRSCRARHPRPAEARCPAAA